MARRILSMMVALALIFSICSFTPMSVQASESNGTNAIKVDVGGGNWDSLWQGNPIPVVDYQYEASFWMKGTGTITLQVMNGGWGGAIKQEDFTATDTWTKYTISGINSGTNDGLAFIFRNSGTDGELYIDDCFLGLPNGDNILGNADFEARSQGWNRDSNPWDENVASPYSIDSTMGRIPPAKALKAHVGGNDWATMWQGNPIPVNDTQYEASFWMKGTGTIHLEVKDGSWSTKLASQDYTATDTWTKYTLTGISSGSNDGLTFIFMDGTSTEGELYIDDCFLGTPNGENILQNADFETSSEGWKSGANAWDETVASRWSIDSTMGRISEAAPTDVLDSNGFIDELNDTDTMLEYSSSSRYDTTNPGSFGNDASRFTRGDATTVGEEVYAIYNTDYDIQSFSSDIFYWDGGSEIRDISVSVSADGDTYTPVTLDRYILGGNWKKVVYSAFEMPIANARYIKVALPELLESESASKWGVQISRIAVNLSTAPVVATPDSVKLSGAADVSLTSTTTGSAIYYFTDKNTEIQQYSAPIHVTGYTKIFAYAKAQGKEKSFTRTFTYYSAAEEKLDTYGQVKSADFDTKVTSDAELQADVAADAAYYGSLTLPTDRDIYGGMDGSKEQYNLEATGFFRTQKVDFDGTEKWVMVDPLGNLYFSLGTNCTGSPGETFTQVQGREYMYQWIPESTGDYAAAFLNGNSANYSPYVANLIKKYGSFDQDEYYKRMVGRLKKIGFTSEGGFAQTPSVENNDTGFPEVKFAYLPDNYAIGATTLFDPYKEGAREAVAAMLIANDVAARKNDPKIVGYFFGNELPYNQFDNAVLNSSASNCPTKGALIDMLATKYTDIAALNTAWETSFESFDAMKEVPILINTDTAVADMGVFFEQYLDKFYEMLSTEFNKQDPNHMLMGDRYLVNVADNASIRKSLSKIAGKYIDVISYNYYTYDVNLDRLKEMTELANKPIMITEFHFGEISQGLGYGLKGVSSEEDKGLYYRYYVEKLAASGYAVGAHWFETMDQAATGRWFQGLTGEAYGIGLFNVADRPYKTFVDSVMATNYNIYDLVTGKDQYLVNPDIPVAEAPKETSIKIASGEITIDGIKDTSYPGGYTINIGADNVSVGQPNGESATVDLAWDNENLYVFAHIHDVTPMMNPNTGFDNWNGDGLEMFIAAEAAGVPGSMRPKDTQLIINGQSGDIHFYRNGASAPVQPTASAITILDEDEQGYTIEASISLAGLFITNPENGRKIGFDVGFDNGNGSNRASQFLWSGVDGNAAARDLWGTATLVEGSSTPSTQPTSTPSPQQDTPSTDPKPVLAQDGSVTLEGKPILDTKTQTATYKVGKELLDNMVKMAKEDSNGTKTISLDVQKVDGANTYLLELPANALNSKDSDLKVEIHTPNGTIIVPSNMFASDKTSNATKIGLSIGIADTLKIDKKVKEAIGDRPVIELNAKVDGKVVDWNNPDAPVTVTIDYKTTETELKNPEHIVVWYIDSKGAVTPVPSARYNPATGKVTFITTHFSTYAVTSVYKTFSDTGKYSWAKNQIEVLASKGILDGVSTDKYSPDQNITRAEFMSSLIKVLGLSVKVDSNFDDVKVTDKFYNEIGIAKKLGLTTGIGKNKFSPNTAISRQDMMVITSKALQIAGKIEVSDTDSVLNKFSDKDQISGYAIDSIATLVKEGIISGVGKTMNPSGKLTKAEAAATLYKLLKL